MRDLPVKAKDLCPKIKDISRDQDRVEGFKRFSIKDGRNTWEIGIKVKLKCVEFMIGGYGNYKIIISDNEPVCKKLEIERSSDSGIVPIKNGKINLYNDEGERKSIRVNNLIKYISEGDFYV